MKRYIKSSRRFGPYNVQYTVHWIGVTGRDCLLGGARTLQEANDIAKRQADELFENPWEDTETKFKVLNSIYIIDVDTGEEAMTYDTEEYIDNLMSALDSRIRRK